MRYLFDANFISDSNLGLPLLAKFRFSSIVMGAHPLAYIRELVECVFSAVAIILIKH